MLVSIDYMRSRLNVSDSSLDDHIRAAAEAAEGQVSLFLRQPIIRGQYRGVAPIVYSGVSDYYKFVMRYSIDTVLISATHYTGDITSTCSVSGSVVETSSDAVCEGDIIRYIVESGWTSSTLPALVRDVICDVAYYFLLQTQLLTRSAAGLSSESRSESGVVTTSYNYDEDYVYRTLMRVRNYQVY